MAKVKTLTIDGVEYVPKGSEVSNEPKNSNIKIVILQRGWVMIGRWSQEGDMCALENAYVIRTWGTTTGLGQLALEGKQPNTRLDKAGSVSFHQLTVIAMIDCREELWDSELN